MLKTPSSKGHLDEFRWATPRTRLSRPQKGSRKGGHVLTAALAAYSHRRQRSMSACANATSSGGCFKQSAQTLDRRESRARTSRSCSTHRYSRKGIYGKHSASPHTPSTAACLDRIACKLTHKSNPSDAEGFVRPPNLQMHTGTSAAHAPPQLRCRSASPIGQYRDHSPQFADGYSNSRGICRN
jgi:hypothetical protein